MRQRLRYLLVILLALGVVGGRRLLFPQIVKPLAPISAPSAQSFLVILGIGEKTDTTWDGSITATGATILSLHGWRFNSADSISGTSS